MTIYFSKLPKKKKIKNGMHLISFTKATTDRFWVTIVITNLSVIDILRLFNVVTSPRPTLFCKQLCSTPRSSSFSSDTIYIYLNTSTLFCSFFQEIKKTSWDIKDALLTRKDGINVLLFVIIYQVLFNQIFYNQSIFENPVLFLYFLM